MIDGILSILDVTYSLTEFNYDFNSVNMLDFFINNSVIENLFWNIFIFTVGLVSISTIIGIIKVIIKNNSSILKILSKFLLAIVATLIVASFIIIVIMLSAKIIEWLKDIFNIDLNFSLSKLIFNNSVVEWYNNYSITEVDLSNITVNELLGDYQKNPLLPEKWLHNGMINPDSFQYLPCFITTIICLISLFLFVINIIKRTYEIILLYLIMPVSISSLPIDDGRCFKNWLELFVNKIVIIYSSILVLNLFFFIFPIINEFKINGDNNGLFKLLIVNSSIIFLFTGTLLFKKIIKFKELNNILVINNEYLSTNYQKNEIINESHRFTLDKEKGVNR